MTERAVIFLHGFASSNQGQKAKHLREAFQQVDSSTLWAINFNPTPLDFEHMTITGMINRLRQFVLERDLEQVHLIGSSMGALVALHYGRIYSVERNLLVAPLLYYQSLGMSDEVVSWWEKRGTVEIDHYAFPGQLPLAYTFHVDGLQYEDVIPPPAPTQIIHGWNDEQVAIEDSRFYAEKYPRLVDLKEVDSDHRLADQLDVIWNAVESFLLIEATGEEE